MATGDPEDMAVRMAAVLPARWFPSLLEAPVLLGLLTGIGTAWSYCYDLLAYATGQARIATAAGVFLDIAASDFFGLALGGHGSLSRANQFLVRVTRSATAAELGGIIGYGGAGDTDLAGGYGGGAFAYGTIALVEDDTSAADIAAAIAATLPAGTIAWMRVE